MHSVILTWNIDIRNSVVRDIDTWDAVVRDAVIRNVDARNSVRGDTIVGYRNWDVRRANAWEGLRAIGVFSIDLALCSVSTVDEA